MIYSCPDCCGDLQDEDGALWCPSCDQYLSYAQIAGDA